MLTRNTFKKKERNSSGRYAKRCSCLTHEQNQSPLLNLERGKKVKKSVIFKLIQQGLLPQKARWLCEECALNATTTPKKPSTVGETLCKYQGGVETSRVNYDCSDTSSSCENCQEKQPAWSVAELHEMIANELEDGRCS